MRNLFGSVILNTTIKISTLMSTKCIVCLHTYKAKNHSELITKQHTVVFNKYNQS